MHKFLAALLLLLAFAGTGAQADYPARPIRFIIPFAVGQSADVEARYVAELLKEKLGQPVVVDNRPGASGIVATQALLAAPADGHTLMMQSASLAIVPSITKVGFDVVKDLQPIARISVTPYVFIVGANSPYRTMAAFVEGARQRPGGLSCGTFGVGSPPHVALEMLNAAASVQIQHVPYRTSTLADLASGVIDCVVETPASALLHAQGGTGRSLGITASKPVDAVPEAVPIAATYPDVDIAGWIGVFAAAGVPAPITNKIENALQEIVVDPGFVKLNQTLGLSTVRGDTPHRFKSDFAAEFRKYRRIVTERGIALSR